MNDSQLIFEQYISTLKEETESHMRTDQGLGKTQSMSDYERSKSLDAYHDQMMDDALESGDVINITHVLGDDDKSIKKVTKFLERTLKTMSEKTYLNQYVNPVGVIPVFKLANVINRLRLDVKAGVFKDDDDSKLSSLILNALEDYYLADPVTSGLYKMKSNLPEWRSYPEYVEKSSGKSRPATFAGRSIPKQGRTTFMRGARDKTVASVQSKYSPDDVDFSGQHSAPKPNAKNVAFVKPKDIEPEKPTTEPKKPTTKKGKTLKEILADKKKKAVKNDKKLVNAESFFRDDIMF